MHYDSPAAPQLHQAKD